MNYNYIQKINIKNLRFIKIIEFNNQFILIGSKLYQHNDNIKKYTLYKYLLDDNFELISDSEEILNFSNIENDYLNNIYKSLWCRNIYKSNEIYYLIIDFNKNIENKKLKSNNYLLETTNFIDFKLSKKYKTTNILHTEYLDNLFMSNIKKDENNIWGKYLFSFNINNKTIKPKFDNFIDYKNDNGHLLHNIYYNPVNEIHKIIFSILDKENKYTVYESETINFIEYKNTLKINFNDFNSSDWYCFPSFFIYNNNYFMIVNQEDFGKKSEPLIFRKKNNILDFIESKYNINYLVSNNLNYEDNKKYIFLEEVINKNGNRYNDIIDNNKDINNYSTHSPSCIDLYNVLLSLKINKDDSILDIGSGKGLALTIMNLIPFNKIKGIELSKNDYNISKYNCKYLNIKNIEIENINALDFQDYYRFNYLYFYNPFNEVIFEEIIKKIYNNINTKIIYNNIHEKEINILENYNFKLLKKIEGLNRDYFIFVNKVNFKEDENKVFNYNGSSYNILKKEIDIKLLNKKIYFDLDYKKNIKYDLSIYRKNNIFTNYDIKHLKNDYLENIPNIETYNNNLIKYSNYKRSNFTEKYTNNLKKKYINNITFIDDAVFISSFSSTHNVITHLMFDFINQINYFYDILKNNKNISIIIEYIPGSCCPIHESNILFLKRKTSLEYYKKNIKDKKYLQDILINFIKNLNLSNDIIFLTNIYKFKNIKTDFLFINKLYHIKLKQIYNITWLPLVSRFIYNKKYELIPNLLNKIIIENSPKNVNIHYNFHKKKFLILEKRTNSTYFRKARNVNINIFHNIKNFCKKYCDKNNLKLVIWDDNLVKKNSIYEQFEICNNAKIIIGFAGSFWLFNYAMQNETTILIFDIIKPELNFDLSINQSNILNITYYTYNNILKNNNLNKYLIWGSDADNKYLNIVKEILKN